MHHTFPAPRLQPLVGTQRSLAAGAWPSPVAERFVKPHVHIGLLDGRWSLESGHWSVDVVRQSFLGVPQRLGSPSEVDKEEGTSPERRILEAASQSARINYRVYGAGSINHPAERVV